MIEPDGALRYTGLRWDRLARYQTKPLIGRGAPLAAPFYQGPPSSRGDRVMPDDRRDLLLSLRKDIALAYHDRLDVGLLYRCVICGGDISRVSNAPLIRTVEQVIKVCHPIERGGWATFPDGSRVGYQLYFRDRAPLKGSAVDALRAFSAFADRLTEPCLEILNAAGFSYNLKDIGYGRDNWMHFCTLLARDLALRTGDNLSLRYAAECCELNTMNGVPYISERASAWLRGEADLPDGTYLVALNRDIRECTIIAIDFVLTMANHPATLGTLERMVWEIEEIHRRNNSQPGARAEEMPRDDHRELNRLQSDVHALPGFVEIERWLNVTADEAFTADGLKSLVRHISKTMNETFRRVLELPLADVAQLLAEELPPVPTSEVVLDSPGTATRRSTPRSTVDASATGGSVADEPYPDKDDLIVFSDVEAWSTNAGGRIPRTTLGNWRSKDTVRAWPASPPNHWVFSKKELSMKIIERRKSE
jgi:hypothetical protein